MPDEPIWKSGIRAIWANKWARFLAFVFLAFEIYLNAILPAIERTVLLQKTIAETRASSGQSLPFPGSRPDPDAAAITAKCEDACRIAPDDIAKAKAAGRDVAAYCHSICRWRPRL